MDNYKFDMHVHTSETSACGEVPGAEAARLYRDAGYQGIMVTDHYHKIYFDGLGNMDPYDKIEAFLRGYRAAKQEGDKIGLDVLLGIEFRNFETEDDFLIVGITEKFLHDYPDTYELPLEEAIDLFHENGMLVIQAHPVRFRMIDMREGRIFNQYKNYEMLEIIERTPDIKEVLSSEWELAQKNGELDQFSYPLILRVCELRCEQKLDGIEVYNGNYHWSQRPEVIQEIVKNHPDYILVSCSDFHETGHAARGGMVFDRRVRDLQELKRILQGDGIIGQIRR